MIKILSLSARGFKQLDIDELTFPQKGTVLIVGRNEAGKSTLFEAIYFALFGEGLVPSRGAKSLPELLGYKREKGLVSLKFSVSESIFEVTRILKRKGANEHRLKVLSPRQETITGAKAVNDRIEKELMLDGDALLNSCFVEQKNLEKLENLKSEERQRSIARLLNIETFKIMEDDFKEETKQLEEEEVHDRQKLELATLLEEIPFLDAEKGKIEHKLNLIEMIREKGELSRKIEEGNTRTESLRRDMERIENQKEEIETLQKILPSKEERLEKFRIVKDSLRTYNMLLEGIRGKKEELTTIISDVEHARDTKERMEEFTSVIENSKSIIRKKKEEQGEIAKIVSLFKNRSFLVAWEASKKYEDEVGLLEEKENETEKKRRIQEKNRDDYLFQKKKEEIIRLGTFLTFAVLLISGLVCLGVITLLSYAKIWIVPLGLIIVSLIVYFCASRPAKKRLSLLKEEIEKNERALKEYEDELLRLDGERRAIKSRRKIEIQDSSDTEKEMKEFGYIIPTSLEECHKFQNDLNNRLANFEEEEINEGYRKISEDILSLNSSVRANEETIERFQVDMRKYDLQKLEMGKEMLAGEIEKKKSEARRISDECENRARQLGVEADYEGVMKEHSRLSEEIATDKKSLQKKDGLTRDIEFKKGELDSIVSLVETNRRKIEKIDRILKGDRETDGLSVASEAELKKERDMLVGKLTHQKSKSEELKSILGISHVEKLKCEKQLAQTERAISITTLAREIVIRARRQIEANVLPRIEDNMEKFIPLLTADRYKEVFINPNDYKIEVMDEVAGERRPKNVFSGGTRDQFSLALRLSFALATLPEERGSSPSFIFLDEPIGAFDEERRNALIELLTVGEISESFDQIFIISHFSELEDVFEYKIKMDGGKVVETNL